MKRTKLSERQLPQYTKGEELFNTISHGCGIPGGIAALLLCLRKTGNGTDPASVSSCIIYCLALIVMYSVSCIYHCAKNKAAKKILQIIDHCTIYVLIAGTYTPVLTCAISKVSPIATTVLMCVVWGCALVGIVLTAIDLKRFNIFSMLCYVAMGWCILAVFETAVKAIPYGGLVLLVLGGISYTVGAVIYGIGKRHKYMHGVFHVLVLLGSIFQFAAIYGFII